MATTFRSKSNYPLGQGTLNTAIDDNDLSIVLDAGQGASFPASNFTISIDEEIILIDSRSTDTLTVNASGRGYDSSTASAHAAGVAIANYQIVKDFTDCETAINGIENGTTTLAKVITSGTAANTHTIDDAATNTVVSVLELYKTSSGTPAAGIGAKLLLGAEDSAGNKEAAIEVHGILTTVTDASEQGKFLLRVKNAGSFMDALDITVASNTVTVNANQTTANVFNTTSTTVNAFGASTVTTIGASSDGAYVTMCAMRITAVNSSTNGLVGLRANMRVSNSYSNASDNVTLRLECDGASAATKAIQFYRISAAATGATTVTVFVPNTSTVAFEVDAKTGNTTVAGTLTVNGSGSVFGDASTDTFTFTGRMLVRSVTDAGPMTATPGTQREIVYNTSDSKFYGCTVTHGTAATWVAFN